MPGPATHVSRRRLKIEREMDDGSGCGHLEAGGWWGQGLEMWALLSLLLALDISLLPASVFLIHKGCDDCRDLFSFS